MPSAATVAATTITPPSFSRQIDSAYRLDGKHPSFADSRTYTESLNQAKRDLRPLLIYLHSWHHDDSADFCRKVLADNQVLQLLERNQVQCWAADALQPEPFKICNALQVTSFPFLALIASLDGGRMQVVLRLEGDLNPDRVRSKLDRSLTQIETVLNRQRTERRQREQERELRSQQDAAYQASLARDREKARQAEERKREEERKRQAELDQQRRAEERLQRMAERREECRRRLKPEPDQNSASGGSIVTLAVRLPDGRRVDRRFFASDPVQVLYDFVGQFDLGTECERFVCCLPVPRRPLNDRDVTLERAGLAPRGMVVVEEVYDDEELD